MLYDIHTLTVHTLKRGYRLHHKAERYECLFCGATYEQGCIYPVDAQLMDAQRAMQAHIQAAHGSAAQQLLSEDKRTTGLTQAQSAVLLGLFNGLSDNDIAAAAGITAATVRSQRFSFREKAKQAKVILALYELLEEIPRAPKDSLVAIHGGATMVDERYMVTDAQADKAERTFFTSLSPLKLQTFPAREKNKIIILRKIAEQFDPAQRYTEKQVSSVLKDIYSDFATLRRYLIEYGFMDRTNDGSAYWIKPL